MASLRVEGDGIQITLTPSERVFGLLRDLRIPTTSIRSVEVVPNGRAAVRGMRAPGRGGPVRLIGTWRSRNNRQYVSIRRGQPAVKLGLAHCRYDTALIGADDAEEIAAAIAAAR